MRWPIFNPIQTKGESRAAPCSVTSANSPLIAYSTARTKAEIEIMVEIVERISSLSSPRPGTEGTFPYPFALRDVPECSARPENATAGPPRRETGGMSRFRAACDQELVTLGEAAVGGTRQVYFLIGANA